MVPVCDDFSKKGRKHKKMFKTSDDAHPNTIDPVISCVYPSHFIETHTQIVSKKNYIFRCETQVEKGL